MGTEILSRRLYPRPDNGSPAERAAYDFWWDKIIVDRNHFFVRRTKSQLRRGGVVIAVGALHLPTDDGMIELLRAEGFTVTRID
ncbi:MAG: TraB/GumN family protein [Pikeienuella sp.]